MNVNTKDIKQSLEEIFGEILDISQKESINSATMLEMTKWDSLAQVLIISAIEARFNLKISAKDFADITSFKAAHIFVTEKLSHD